MAKPKKKKKKPAPRKRIARRRAAKKPAQQTDSLSPSSPLPNLNQIAPKLTFKIVGIPILPKH